MNDLKTYKTLDMLTIPQPTSHQRKYVAEHSSCAMCESHLEVRHEVGMSRQKIKEEAHCPSCGIRVRVSHHLMH